MFDAVDCVDTFKYIFDRIVYRVLSRLDCKTLVAHILKRDYLVPYFLLSQLYSSDVLVFHMVRTVYAAVYAVV